MTIYITIVTDNKTGIREIGHISNSLGVTINYRRDNIIRKLISHTEEWKIETTHGETIFEFVKEYVTEEDFNN